MGSFIDNSIGNPIGNSMSNSIGNLIGNSIYLFSEKWKKRKNTWVQGTPKRYTNISG